MLALYWCGAPGTGTGQRVGVRAQTGWRASFLVRNATRMSITSSVKTRPFGYCGGLDGSKVQHVRQDAVLVERGDRLLARVAAGVAQQVDELVRPPARSLTGSLALYSSLVSSVLKKLLIDGCPARSAWTSSPSRRTLHRPQILQFGLGGQLAPSAVSMAMEKTLAALFESTPVHG